jgi:hypothetical protein
MSAGDDILPADGDFEASREAGSPRIFDAFCGRFFCSFRTVLRATEGDSRTRSTPSRAGRSCSHHLVGIVTENSSPSLTPFLDLRERRKRSNSWKIPRERRRAGGRIPIRAASLPRRGGHLPPIATGRGTSRPREPASKARGGAVSRRMKYRTHAPASTRYRRAL